MEGGLSVKSFTNFTLYQNTSRRNGPPRRRKVSTALKKWPHLTLVPMLCSQEEGFPEVQPEVEEAKADNINDAIKSVIKKSQANDGTYRRLSS